MPRAGRNRNRGRRAPGAPAPALRPVDGDSSDDSPPPLEARDRTTVATNNSNTNNTNNINNNNNESDDSSDGEPPPLVPRVSNRGSDSDSDDEDGTNRNDNNREFLPGARSGFLQRNAPPRRTPAQAQARPQPPPPPQRPAAAPRAQQQRQQPQNQVSDSDDSDMPDLLPRDNHAESDDSEDGNMPELLPRARQGNVAPVANSDSDSDDDEMPALLPRGEGNQSDSDSDDYDDNVGMPTNRGAPGTRATRRAAQSRAQPQRRTQSLSDSDAESQDSDDVPKLVSRQQSQQAAAAAQRVSQRTTTTAAAQPVPEPEDPRKVRQREITAEGFRLTESQLKLFLTLHEIDIRALTTKPALVSSFTTTKMMLEDRQGQSTVVVPNPLPIMPKSMNAVDPPKDGAWLLLPEQQDLFYVHRAGPQTPSLVRRAHDLQQLGLREAVLVPGTFPGSVWVYGKQQNNTSFASPSTVAESWCVYHRSETAVGRILYTLPHKAIAVVPNGLGGCWTLLPINSSGGTARLVLFSGSFPKGKEVASDLPLTTQLYLHGAGGVFVRLPAQAVTPEQDNQSTNDMRSGLWFVSIFGAKQCLMPVMQDEWFVSHDSYRSGIWVLAPGRTTRTCVLTHISDGGMINLPGAGTTLASTNTIQPLPTTTHPQQQHQVLDVDFTSVQTLLVSGSSHHATSGTTTTTSSVVFLHHKDDERWKISYGRIGQRTLEFFHDCPKNNRICGDGNGGLWMTKKVGKATDRVLLHLDREATLAESPDRYPHACILQSA